MKAKKGKKAQRRKMRKLAAQVLAQKSGKKPANRVKKGKKVRLRPIGWTTERELFSRGKRPSGKPLTVNLGSMVTEVPDIRHSVRSLHGCKSAVCADRHIDDDRVFGEVPPYSTLIDELATSDVDDDCDGNGDELDDAVIALMEARLKGVCELAIEVLGQARYAELIEQSILARQGSPVARVAVETILKQVA